jgi:hypothetical protein
VHLAGAWRAEKLQCHGDFESDRWADLLLLFSSWRIGMHFP